MLFKGCRYLVTQDAERRILEHVDIRVEHGLIVEIGEGLRDEEELDCSARIVLPGLINTHTHLAMGLLRGIGDDHELHRWLAEVLEAERGLSSEERYQGALAGCEESLRFGTTSVADMHTAAAETVRAVAESGIRAWFAPGLRHAAEERDGMLHMTEEAIEALLDSLPEQERLTYCLGPHSIYLCSEQMLRNVTAVAKRRGLRQHIHLAETRKEQYDCKRLTGKLPVKYLDSIGFLDVPTLLAHCIWLTKGELRRLAERGASVAHCPVSNMKLASGGVMPLQELGAAGVNVSLATDSVVSNDTLDMFEEMKMGALLHKHHYWDPTAASAQRMLDMATRNGATALGAADIGSIEPGKRADIITLGLEPHLLPLDRERVVNHLVYAAKGQDVRETLVDGRLLLQEGRLTRPGASGHTP